MKKQEKLFDEDVASRALELAAWLKVEIKGLRSRLQNEQNELRQCEKTLWEIRSELNEAMTPRLIEEK
jgi:hypothetical protein